MRLFRLFRRVARTATPSGEAPDYKAAWNEAARADAHDAILTGSTAESFERTGESDAAMIRRYLPARGGVVLNIGCGVGRIERYLAPHVAQMHAVDVSGEMIARARERLAGLSNVSLRETGNDEFLRGFESDRFDLVFSFLVLQHLSKEDAFLYLRDAFRVLKPGGVLFIQFPNLLSPEYTRAFTEGADVKHRSPGRVRFYTEVEVRHLLAVLGFQVAELWLASGERGDTEIYAAARKRLTI
ncbi:MAG: class I SAM-dependent methyltransferase [Thermoanaerobaculia bacterium]